MLVTGDAGPFLEDEVPFAPAPAPGPLPPTAPDPSDPALVTWARRWRIPLVMLLVALVSAATVSAFKDRPEQVADSVSTDGVSTGSLSTTGSSTGQNGALLGFPATTAAAAADPSGSSPASLPSTDGADQTPSSAATAATPSSGSVTTRAATTASTRPPVTTPTTVATTRPKPSSTVPATTTPGYATGSTQFRGPNDPPFIANPGQRFSQTGQAERYQIGVSARPGESLTFSASGLPRGLAIDARSGLITGTPTRRGISAASVTVVSSTGQRFTQGFTWVVTGR